MFVNLLKVETLDLIKRTVHVSSAAMKADIVPITNWQNPDL